MSKKNMNDAVKEVMDEAVKTAEAIAESVEPAVKKAKAAAKKAEPVVKAAVQTAKDTGKRVSNALVTEAYIQYGTNEYDFQQITEACKADFRAANKGAIKTCRIYIKPEEGMAYYVINEIAGKIAL